jgi:hypothetical protein
MAFDAHANFPYSTIAVAPSPATSGLSLTVASGEGVRFPVPPFNVSVWPANSNPLTSNAEIVRVTAIVSDVFTIVRIQEATSARTIVVGDQIAASITKKILTDIEAATVIPIPFVVNANSGAAPTPPSQTVMQLIGANANIIRAVLDAFGGAAVFDGRRANGPSSAPTKLLANDQITELSVKGYGATGYSSSGRAHIRAEAPADWSDTSQPTRWIIDTTPVGSIVPIEVVRINSDGRVSISPAGQTTALGATVLSLSSNITALPAPDIATPLQVGMADGAAGANIILDAFGAPPALTFRRANTSAAAPSALAADDPIVSLRALGYQSGGAYTGSRGAIRINAAEAWTAANQGSYIAFLTTLLGSTATAAERMRIAAGVQIGAPTSGDIANSLNVAGDIYRNGVAIFTSPAITGTPTAPTAAPGTNTTQIATTAFVAAAATDAALAITDVTTNNVSSTKHGFAPKTPNDSAQFLNGAGGWAVPATVTITSPVTQTITLTGTQNDVSLTASCTQLRCNNASLLTITGLSAGVAGQRLQIISVGAGQVDLSPQAAGSTAANRLLNTVTVGATSLAPGTGSALYEYDATSARWRLMFHEQGNRITRAYTAGDFTITGGTFTVDAGDLSTFNFYLKGKMLHINLAIGTATISLAVAALRVALPGGYQAAQGSVIGTGNYFDSGAWTSPLHAMTTANGAYMDLYKQNLPQSANWAVGAGNNINLNLDVIVEIN